MPYAPEYLHLVITGVRFQAYLYGRNSDNEFAGIVGARDSVDDQLATGRTLCARHEWPIIREFKDSDLSASRHAKKARDDFEDLIAAITADAAPDGVRRIVVAYEASRYYRDLDAYLRLRKACMAANVLLCYNGQVYDLSRRDDRKVTAQHAIDAEDEADVIQERNDRTAALQAEAGKPHGRLPFGYAREYAVVGGRSRCIRQYEHPTQGKYVVKALKHIDGGGSARSLLRWLRSDPGAARPDGSEWSPRTVRVMLLNRAYLGERLHHGTYRRATWEPLKGLETPAGQAMFNRVTAILTDPERRTARGTEVAHLLTYLGLCGQCGDDAMLTHQKRAGGRSLLGCEVAGDTTICEDVADAVVEEALIRWFCDKPVARAALLPNAEDVEGKVVAAQRLIAGLEGQLAEARALAEDFDEETGRPRLSATSLASMEAKLEPKLVQQRQLLKVTTGVSPLLLRMLEAKDPQEVWNGGPDSPGLSLEQKREIIRSVVTVRLDPAPVRGLNRVDVSRVRLAFAGEPGFRVRLPRARGTVRAAAPRSGAAAGTG
ncbi:recombinase family protein [Streptomyces umbrinus]|uniref:recombinase family protein n=1 Tax=Streptomyces umbrinus TaxID=67370 RepID=UPI003C2B3064